MAASVNKVTIVGNLGRDPEVRSFQNGGKVVNFSVATSETWNDKQSGERKEKTEWHNVVVRADHATKYAEQYLKKGSKVYVEGKLETRKWTDQQGVEKYTTEVIIGPFNGVLLGLDGRQDGEGSGSGGGGRGDRGQSRNDRGGDSGRRASGGAGGGQHDPDLDDEIPF